MATGVVGRDSDLAVLEAFLDPSVESSRALVIEGEAGIGKSTLWAAGVEMARRAFAHVLVSQPAETESTLANVVLGDLFGQLAPGLWAALPEPRRRALEHALLAGDDDGVAVDPHALAAAVLSVLASLVADGPILLAIDDDQWADVSSMFSLGFALRRLRPEPIVLLLARRVEGSQGVPPGLRQPLEDAVGPGSVERVHVGPLSIGAIQQLLQDRLGVTMSRPNLLRLSEASGGNPFFALELARALPAPGSALGALVVPPSLERLLARRFGDLGAESQRALLLVAAHGRAPLELLRRLGIEEAVLEAPVARGLLDIGRGVVRFTHPLLASTAYQRAGARDRHDAHRALAAAVDDPIGRARHLALATASPDEAVAEELEAAGIIARTRGFPGIAAGLAEHAAELTPLDRVDAARRRGQLAARANLEAGEPDRARTILTTQLAESPPGVVRAEALLLAAEVEEPGPAVELLEAALREATLGDLPRAGAVQAEIHVRLGSVGRSVKGRAWAEEQLVAGRRLADESAPQALRARVRATLALLRFEDGDPAALDLAREAHASALAVADPETLRATITTLGHILTWLRRLDEARTLFEDTLAGAAEHDELLRAVCLWYLALVELWSGRWQLAHQRADAAAEIHVVYGIESPLDHLPHALIAVHRGQFEVAREHSARAFALAEGMMLPAHGAVLALADLWSGKPGDAVDGFARVRELHDRRGLRDPATHFERADHIDALLQLGRVEEAQRLASEWEALAERNARDVMMAEVVRAKGLIAAARGAAGEAASLLEDSARRHGEIGDPFGRGRALLALGIVERRRRQKRRARLALESARELFMTLGAESFAEAARRELAQLGGRQRFEGLSPAEERVAELVAEGRSNREVAAALFLTERTVASYLTRAYAKLGVRSRTELARRLAADAPQNSP